MYIFCQVIFCVSLTEYAQKSAPAEANRMHEAIKVKSSHFTQQISNLSNTDLPKMQ